MLAEIMRFKPCIAIAGTHGKTTTTSLMAHMLSIGGIDPTVINGGIITSLKTNARVGKGDWMVVEADESDGTFIKIPATIAVVTNIEPEHMTYFKTEANLKKCFIQFASAVPFYGFSVLCRDHTIVQSILPKLKSTRILTYGTSQEANCQATNIKASSKGMSFDVHYRGFSRSAHITNLSLSLHGIHNVLNSLSVITIALEFGFSEAIIRQALANFQGVKRRFTKTGEINGVSIIDDYGHHPTEIAAVLKAARDVTSNRVIGVIQPHRYSRVKDLFKEFSRCFGDADELVLAPIYGAGEPALEGITHEALAQETKKHFGRPLHLIQSQEELAPLISKIAQPGDYVICLGAGSISQWANELPAQLENLHASAQ